MTLYIGDKPVGLMKVVKDTKYIDKTKYGVSIDNLLGNVDENGVLQAAAEAKVIDLTGVKSLAGSYLSHLGANGRIQIEEFLLPDCIKNTYSDECNYLFRSNKTIKRAVFGYETITSNCFYYAFAYTSEDFVAIFPNLKKVSGDQTFYYSFYGRDCPDFAETFPVLEEISGGYAFGYCGSLINNKVVHFPSLIKIIGTTGSYNATFYGLSSPIFKLPKCTTLERNYIFPSSTTEIHFAAENQAAIEASAGYATKWGAGSSCTIFFDL